MNLREVYELAIRVGIEHDGRGAEGVERALADAQRSYEKLDEVDREFFDAERLTNPYSDTRIIVGDPDAAVRGIVCGIDMEVGEVLLADRLREKGRSVDLVLAHHPEGAGLTGLHQVMYMQADLWHRHGVGLGAADSLIAERAEEVRRKVLPANHYRAADAAAALDLALMSIHTPADNCVTSFVQAFVDDAAPSTTDDLVRALTSIPEYADAARKGFGPSLIQGRGSARPGKTVVDMTGGTEGPTDALDRLSRAGVDTLVGMHFSEEHKKRAEELRMNLVIAGHISSDTLGMNLVLDEIERAGAVETICVSGMIRVKRS